MDHFLGLKPIFFSYVNSLEGSFCLQAPLFSCASPVIAVRLWVCYSWETNSSSFFLVVNPLWNNMSACLAIRFSFRLAVALSKHIKTHHAIWSIWPFNSHYDPFVGSGLDSAGSKLKKMVEPLVIGISNAKARQPRKERRPNVALVALLSCFCGYLFESLRCLVDNQVLLVLREHSISKLFPRMDPGVGGDLLLPSLTSITNRWHQHPLAEHSPNHALPCGQLPSSNLAWQMDMS